MCHRLTSPLVPRTCAGSFPGRPDAIRDVRTFLAAFLGSCAVTDDAVLLASELCANAIAHSASGQPGGTFTLRSRLTGDGHLHVEVEDLGSPWNGNLAAARSPHGLYLLRQMSADCGIRPGPRGWVTWFTIAVPAARP
jgi:anti-sigma regulatory factor (Ser/Thr protein kinase)